jgi:hypothetical protein
MLIAGYPAAFGNYSLKDKNGTFLNVNQYGLEKAKHIQSINSAKGIIYYKISTVPGQSGCPLVFGGVFVGIHNGGNGKQ